MPHCSVQSRNGKVPISRQGPPCLRFSDVSLRPSFKSREQVKRIAGMRLGGPQLLVARGTYKIVHSPHADSSPSVASLGEIFIYVACTLVFLVSYCGLLFQLIDLLSASAFIVTFYVVPQLHPIWPTQRLVQPRRIVIFKLSQPPCQPVTH